MLVKNHKENIYRHRRKPLQKLRKRKKKLNLNGIKRTILHLKSLKQRQKQKLKLKFC